MPNRRRSTSALSHLLHGEPGGSALLLPLRDAAPRWRVHAHRLVRRAVVGGREPVRADLHDHAAQQPRDRRQLPLGDDHQRRADHRGHRTRPAADRRRRGGVPDPGRLPRLHLRREHVGGRTGPGRRRPLRRHRHPGRADLPVLLPLGLRGPVQLAGRRLAGGHRRAVDPGAADLRGAAARRRRGRQEPRRHPAGQPAAVRRHGRRADVRHRGRDGVRRLRDDRALLLGLHLAGLPDDRRARVVGRRRGEPDGRQVPHLRHGHGHRGRGVLGQGREVRRVHAVVLHGLRPRGRRERRLLARACGCCRTCRSARRSACCGAS